MKKILKETIDKVRKIIVGELAPLYIVLMGYPMVYKNQLLNDMDIYIGPGYSTKELERVEKRIARELGYGGVEIVSNFNQKYDLKKHFHFDIHSMPKRFMPTIRMATLRDRGIVIYRYKPDIPKFEIPNSEKFRRLVGQIQHMVLAEKNNRYLKMLYAMKTFLLFGTWVEKDIAKRWRKNPNFPNKKDTEEFFEEAKQILKDKIEVFCHLNLYPEMVSESFYKAYSPKGLRCISGILGPLFLDKIFWWKNRKEKLTGVPDYGMNLMFSIIYYFLDNKEKAEYYLGKVTRKTKPLRQRLLKLWSLYFLQKVL